MNEQNEYSKGKNLYYQYTKFKILPLASNRIASVITMTKWRCVYIHFLKIMFWDINLIACKHLREGKGPRVAKVTPAKQKEKKNHPNYPLKKVNFYVFTSIILQRIKKWSTALNIWLHKGHKESVKCRSYKNIKYCFIYIHYQNYVN